MGTSNLFILAFGDPIQKLIVCVLALGQVHNFFSAFLEAGWLDVSAETQSGIGCPSI
jgi:hypothetical protein